MPERSLSGLDESAIDAADLRHIHESFRFVFHDVSLRALPLVLELQGQQVHASQTLHALDVGIGPAPRRTGLFGLLRRNPYNSVPIPQLKLRLRRDLAAAMKQPVPRRRMFADELSRDAAVELYRQLYDRAGELGGEPEVLALYAHVPPECAGSIRIEENLSQAWFSPDSSSSGKLSCGYHLTLLRMESGKLRRLLLRLG